MNAANSKTETVLITGASSGIGLELAKCFAADKSNLILVARNQDALEKLAAELRREHGITVLVLAADLTQSESAQKIFEQTGRAGLRVDVLVNNAGFGLQGGFQELPLPRQLEIIHLNITALTALTGLFLPGMIKQGRGGILNVGSVAGFLPGPNMAVYYASKAFVQSFTEALAAEFSGNGLTINVLCPGPTESNFGQVARGNKVRPVQVKKFSAQTVARAGHKHFRAGKVICVPGIANKLLVFAPRILPRNLSRHLVKHYNSTKSETTENKTVVRNR